MALALAFGVAKVVVNIFTFLSIITTPWIMSGGAAGGPPFISHWLDYRFFVFQLVLGFLGGAIAGALAAVIYNGVIGRNTQAE